MQVTQPLTDTEKQQIKLGEAARMLSSVRRHKEMLIGQTAFGLLRLVYHADIRSCHRPRAEATGLAQTNPGNVSDD